MYCHIPQGYWKYIYFFIKYPKYAPRRKSLKKVDCLSYRKFSTSLRSPLTALNILIWPFGEKKKCCPPLTYNQTKMWGKKEVLHLHRYKRYKRCFANKKHSRKLLFAGDYHSCHVNMGLSGCEGEKAERRCSESPCVSGGAVVTRQDWADCLKTVTPSSCCRLLYEPRHISLSRVLGRAWSWRVLLQGGASTTHLSFHILIV